ncbi:DNA primase [Pseudoflavonifractor capillosus]|uniref:DNA primase n=1 Tax=Pseudoflavonifractor capillosus TaxID=106588 RepID=UPI00195817F4|nr:DNA primase [Pseudoflavonifractor capillosus]MBM6896153.1 DNA primase [Pseudoflavonifractor capillosus]
MAIPEQFLDELSSRLNIVDVVSAYVPLTRKGGNYWGLCPFHREKTPSFSVSESKQIFHCFGCGKGGGAVRFVMEVENLPFPEAVRKLAAQAGMEVPEDNSNGAWREKRQRILELNKEAARFYRAMLSQPEGQRVAEYIAKKRRISPKFSARFGLGAAPDAWDRLILAMREKGYDKADLIEAGLAVAGKNGGVYDKYRNRLMLPVIDVRGNVIGFTSRVMDDSTPKYLNTPETAIFKKRSILYGLNYAKNTKRPNMILVEGNIDVITLHQAGFDNTIATMGTALTEEHIKILEKYTQELVLCYDNDNAGVDATQRAIALLKGSQLSVKVLQLPRRRDDSGQLVKQDADDFIKHQGPEVFEGLLQGCANSVEYRLEEVRQGFDLSQDDQKAQYLQAAAGLVAGLNSPVEREIYGNRAADAAGISREAMAQEVEQQRRQKGRQARRQEERRSLTPTQTLQPKQRELRYTNVRSALAEEGVLRVVLLDGSYFAQLEDLQESDFSAPLLGRAYGLLRRRWQEGKPVTLAALDGVFTPEEMDHLSSVVQQPQPMHTAQAALSDYKQTILAQHRKADIHSGQDLAQLRDLLKQKKSYGG